MADRGHVQRVLAVSAALVHHGADVHVCTHTSFRADVERIGATFVDLFGDLTVDDVDRESWPRPVRYAAFAAEAAERLSHRIRPLRPSVIVYDTFAVIATVVARILGVPRVNVCAGHNVAPAPFLAILRAHPRVRVSDDCRNAVARLNERVGLQLSPFSYVDNLSPDLNVYCEPPTFLDGPDREPFQPVSFFGSLHPSDFANTDPAEPSPFGTDAQRHHNVFVSFGTVIWDVRRVEVLAALQVLVEAFSARDNVRVILSLGGAALEPAERAALRRDRVEIDTYVDQRLVLRHAGVFVTHHGLNSTHESIACLVPMLSYPFAWDQPDLASTCQRLGVAVPLTTVPAGPMSVADVHRAMDRVDAERDAMQNALAAVRQQEIDVVLSRPEVVRQILSLGAR